MILAFSSSETVDSAAEKCLNLNCSAVNAKPVGYGFYDIIFLKKANGRIHRKGSHCVSGKLHIYIYK